MVRQFIQYGLIGVSNTAIDFFAYTFFTRIAHLHFVIANAIGFILAVTWSFFWNKRWTFKEHREAVPHQFLKFFLVMAVGLTIAEVSLYIMVRHFHLHDLLAKFFTIFLVLCWNFPMSRYVVFKTVASDGSKSYTGANI